MTGTIEIVVLPGLNRPHQYTRDERDKEQRERDQQVQHFHVQFLRRDAARAEFPTTSSELRDIPRAAIHGATHPAAAAGRAHRL